MPSNNSYVGDIQTDINRIKQHQTYLFVDKNFQESIIEYFQFLRREGVLCDVTLRVGDHKFSCHKNVLGVASPYFRSLFIDNDTGKLIKNVDMSEEFDHSIMEALLAYMYGGKIFLNIDNAVDIFKGACFFKLPTLMEECSYLLVKFLTPENCMKIRDILFTTGHEMLYQRCGRFVCDNFEAIAGTTQFLEMAVDDLEKLLSSNDVRATSEQQVFDGLVRWTEHDRKKRGIHFAKLLQHVRLPLLPVSVLMDHVEREELVNRSPTAKEMVLEAMRFNTVQDNLKDTLSSPRTVPRTCSTLVDVIMFVGGKGASPKESLVTFCYEPVKNKWYTVAPIRTQLYNHSVAVVDGLVYACAGSVEGKASLLLQDKVQCFNPHLNHWDFVAPLLEPRAKAAATEQEGLLYVSGGMMDGSHGNSFEVYNPISDRWKLMTAPNNPRTSHAMVTTATHIYVIGGEGQGAEPEISMERYDPAVDLWSFVLPMNCGKVGACAVELDEKIYVIGGYNGYTTLRQCEVYDIETHQWNMIQDMTEFRQDAQAVILNNKIYVIGGRDYKGERLINSIECYEASERKWRQVTPIPIVRDGFKCVTFKISHNHLTPMKVKSSTL